MQSTFIQRCSNKKRNKNRFQYIVSRLALIIVKWFLLIFAYSFHILRKETELFGKSKQEVVLEAEEVTKGTVIDNSNDQVKEWFETIKTRVLYWSILIWLV